MGKKTTIALTVGAAGVAAWAASKVVSKQIPREPKTALEFNETVVLAAHGGSVETPENTMAAFSKSVETGVHGFAIDIRLTKDEEIIVFQDELTDRTTDFSGKVADYTWEELNRADAGYMFQDEDGAYAYRGKGEKILRLQELLAAFPHLLFVITIKDSPDTYEGSLMPSKLWRLLETTGDQDRVAVTSPFDEQTDRFNLYAQNKVAIGAGNEEQMKAYTSFTSQFGHLYKPNADLFCLSNKKGVFSLRTEAFIQFLKGLNIKVYYKGVNDPERAAKLMTAGASGFITDNPSDMMKLVQSAEQ
ncbi:glycerophosphoryl diester phosphodiesterase [Sporosarcina sp. NCCP-2222]|uniref:glycerophosphodiester phosphodiesterase family protein n=1 Tax=Sporosarcina sp. NCCP-2222 TaxID=2935073 RepID=UPI002085DB82|nr:glycerophosphodiester phosphodiesterase family protein [Sporosarcina sp. NCCP-2222]GKV55702.1 glycerophosphoryl diester phosphodiesterase [Sporosarcina sp. NCCP-2222]